MSLRFHVWSIRWRELPHRETQNAPVEFQPHLAYVSHLHVCILKRLSSQPLESQIKSCTLDSGLSIHVILGKLLISLTPGLHLLNNS
jgi:hypothetical protein